MDWVAAIDKNREALMRVLALLLAMVSSGAPRETKSPATGFSSEGTPVAEGALPRRLHRAVLRLLRPAEAALRRLIIVAARDISLPPFVPSGPRPRKGRVGVRPSCPLSLPMFDALPRARRKAVVKTSGVPRISVPGTMTPFAIAPRRSPLPDDPVPAVRLGLRLAALGRVLDDLPRAARRFARWRDAVMSAPAARVAARKPCRLWPLRPGRPPGLPRRRVSHEVHDILGVVHGLAFWALEARDTS